MGPSQAESAGSAPVAIIPARYASTRFPGKPLAILAGKPMIEHVWRRCQESGAFSRVIIATDDERIASVASGFAEVARTSPSCRTGTERVAEVARGLPVRTGLAHVQGDEPAVHPESLRQLAGALKEPGVQMATLVRRLLPAERRNPNVVKAALALNGDALYFSRADIPHQSGADVPARYAHLGLYAYQAEALFRLAELPPSPLELAEALEQLRALQNGICIRCVLTRHHSVAVDVPEDVARAEAALAALRSQATD